MSAIAFCSANSNNSLLRAYYKPEPVSGSLCQKQRLPEFGNLDLLLLLSEKTEKTKVSALLGLHSNGEDK